VNVNSAIIFLCKKFSGLARKEFGNNLVSIILFGSAARKEAGPRSDIDLMLVFNKLPTGRLARSRLLESIDNQLEKDLARLRTRNIYTNFNCLMKTKKEARIIRPLYLDMTQDAVYLYDKANFFRSVINNLKRRLKRLGSVRKKVGLARYWELKPDIKPGEEFEI
jgi:predicted nucleotidyltransferase